MKGMNGEVNAKFPLAEPFLLFLRLKSIGG